LFLRKQVVVFLGTKIPGAQSVFQKQVMDGGDYLKDAREGTTAEESASLSLEMSTQADSPREKKHRHAAGDALHPGGMIAPGCNQGRPATPKTGRGLGPVCLLPESMARRLLEKRHGAPRRFRFPTHAFKDFYSWPIILSVLAL